MLAFQSFINRSVKVEISGKELLFGKLLDVGNDLIVIYDGNNFIYIPFTHIQHFSTTQEDENDYSQQGEAPFDPNTTLSLRSIFSNAKGLFTEIKVAGNQSIHGYITSVQSDYLIFYSPVYKTMYIPINHLKWLIPYQNSQTPYALEKSMLPTNPSNLTIARSFSVQLKKLIGKIVVFDLGTVKEKIGQLRSIDNNFIELVTAKQDVVYLNLNHILSVHFE